MDELVRALGALGLQSLPEAAIRSVFDTGGTAPRHRPLGGDSNDECDAEDDGDNDADDDDKHAQAGTTALDRLLDVERVFRRQLKQHLASRRRDDPEDAEPSDDAGLWSFLTSEGANARIMGEADARSHSYAAYHALFAHLHAMINISDGYATLDAVARRVVLMKAAVAARIYLTWLQLPGGSAYGLFMPFVYRQVLDVAKKWIDAVVNPETVTTTTAPSSQQAKRQGRKPQRRDRDDDADAAQRRLVKIGAELLDGFVGFLENFTLSSSKESIVPTVEMVCYIQSVGTGAEQSAVVAASARAQRILDSLLNGAHGDIQQLARVVVHVYVPGVAFQDTAALENRNALKFHRVAMDVIQTAQAAAVRTIQSSEEEEEDDGQVSSLFLGTAQNICLRAPDRAEERQRVLAFVFETCMAPQFHAQERVRFVQFLSSYARSVKAKNRQFAVELVGKLILEPQMWTTASSVDQDVENHGDVAPLLEILADRSRDKVSSVRAKAISAISSVLTAGLAEGNTEENDATASIIAGVLGDILYSTSEDSDAHETPLMQRLVELFRDGLNDEKTYVRKAAVQALEALIVVRPGSIDPTMKTDLFDLQARSTDSSVLVRVQVVKSLSSILLTFPDDEDAQRLWNIGVLPLCVDPEVSVQSAALELTNKVIFDRICHWHKDRQDEDSDERGSSVWQLVSHLDGALARCVQKALRLLLKESKVNVKRLTRAAIGAIKSCLAELDETGEAEPQYWSFSWVILEDLAHSGQLIEAAKTEQHNLSIVVDCWSKLQDEEIPVEFAEGSKRVLRVIAALSPVIDAQDAKELADSILSSLHSFSIPIHVLAEAVLALHSICKSKAPSPEKGREISFAWGKQLLAACEANLRLCFEGQPELVNDQLPLIQKQLISIGEVALLEFSKDDDKNRESGVTLIPISAVIPLIQLFLLPDIVPNNSQSSQPTSYDSPVKVSSPVSIPIPVRVCAFVTLGKLCLRDQDLAKNCITMLIRELRTCNNQDIRSNILLILGDLCIRYTALVDVYVPTIALSFLDESPLLRRNALLLFSQLILQDYIKWRESLLRFFLRAVVDEDEELSNLARHVLCGPLLQKSPHLFTNKFIEMIFVFNKFNGKVNFSEPFEREGIEEIALPGSSRFPKRSQLYKFMLQNMSDEQKLQISMKLCTEILEEVTEGKLKLCDNPSEISDFGTEAILKDTFAILCSPDVKLSTPPEQGDDDIDADEQDGGEAPSVASQLAAAKGKLLSKMSKKNFLENIVPVLIGLKHKLESKRSPLMKYLLHYIRELFKLYGDEVREILNADPQLAMEIEYDLRQYELQQRQQQDNHNQSRRLSLSALTPTKAGQNAGPQTPLQSLEGAQTPLLLSSAARARRRTSMPTAGTPAHPVVQRHISSEESKKDATGPMLFSPDQAAGARGKWHVTARSPVVAHREGRTSRSTRFTQEALEETMQRDLAAAFDSASSPPASPRANDNTNKENHQATARTDNADSDEDVARLPLKKKLKKKTKPTTRSKKSRVGQTQGDEEQPRDPLELQTPKVQRAKRKRK